LENLKASGADGANMIITPASAIVLYPHVYKKLSYVPLKDFTPISSVCSSPFSLTVGPKVPASVKTVADFVAWCKANPKEASYGSSGAGSMPHFAGVMFARAAGFDFLHVPYRGAAPAIQDLLGGQIAANMAVLSTALPNIRSGELRSIALTGAARSAFLPDVPTLAEAGFKDIVVEEWFGIFAPAGLRTEMVDRLNKSINAAIKSKSVMEGFSKFSFTSGGESAADFARIVKGDLERWAPVVSASGFAPEE
jgi:tripartite-type tricarboxylate transporter receptor subunit TctC